MPDLSLFTKLQSLRSIVGPIEITSGYRTQAFNAKVGGHPNSFHLNGLAVDIKFAFHRFTIRQLTQITKGLGFKNVGFYYRSGKLVWMHLDIGKPWRGNFYTFEKYV